MEGMVTHRSCLSGEPLRVGRSCEPTSDKWTYIATDYGITTTDSYLRQLYLK
jgi:hypothetical protein